MPLLLTLQGSILYANLLHVHYDPNYWKNPEEFNPNRFFNEETNTYISNERIIPFSVGKRYCLGQSLAEKEFFLFFAGLIQHFEFSPCGTLPKIGKNSGNYGNALRCVPNYKTILKLRK